MTVVNADLKVAKRIDDDTCDLHLLCYHFAIYTNIKSFSVYLKLIHCYISILSQWKKVFNNKMQRI